MIEDLGKYYLYRHIRLDKNEPFYVGLGTKKNFNTHKSIYARAYETKVGRSQYWKNITNKTKYDVEIFLESDNYDFIKQKEIEFVHLYKRKDCCDGTLVNLTDGGEGFCSNHSTKSKKQMSATKKRKREEILENIKEKVISLYNEDKRVLEISKIVGYNVGWISEIIHRNNIPLKRRADYFDKKNYFIYKFKEKVIEKRYEKISELSKYLNVAEGVIRNHVRDNRKIRDFGFLILDYETTIENALNVYNKRVLNKSKIQIKKKRDIRKIVQKDLKGNIIKVWDSIGDIIKNFNLKTSTPILRVIKNQRKKYKNSIWERLT